MAAHFKEQSHQIGSGIFSRDGKEIFSTLLMNGVVSQCPFTGDITPLQKGKVFEVIKGDVTMKFMGHSIYVIKDGKAETFRLNVDGICVAAEYATDLVYNKRSVRHLAYGVETLQAPGL